MIGKSGFEGDTRIHLFKINPDSEMKRDKGQKDREEQKGDL